MFVSTVPFISSLFGVVLSEVQYVWLSGDVSTVIDICLCILQDNTFCSQKLHVISNMVG